jgi:hypothetical protein
MTATRTDIIDTFFRNPTPPPSGQIDYWDVDGDTYINSIPLTLDRDYLMGYLIEVVEKSTSTLSYLAVVAFYGPDENGYTEHDAEWWPDDAGTFFDRKVDLHTVSQWAITKMFGLIESWQDRRTATSKQISTKT